MALPAYIIHLERAVQREPNVARLCSVLGPETRVMSAVDGSAVGVMKTCDLKPRAWPTYPFRLRPAEIATFQSHRACWQDLVDAGYDAALIVEDDILIEPPFQNGLALALEHLQPGMVVRFPQSGRERGKTLAAGSEGLRLMRPSVIGLGMLATLITRDAALRLLQASEAFDRPVDTFLQMTWLHGTDVLTVVPSGVREVSRAMGGTLIHAPLSLPAKLRREVLRPLYRTALRLRSAVARF